MTKNILNKRVRIGLATVVGLVVAILVLIMHLGWTIAYLAGWDAAAVTFIVSVLYDFSGHSRERTAEIAKKLDISGWSLDAIVLVAATASLVAVAALLGGHSGGHLWRISFGLVSIILGWASVHLLFMIRYAAAHYQGEGDVDFNDREVPRFSDFAYLAFTIGMTYQVSDTNLRSGHIRKIALGHALISFVFGTVIIATTINLVAGLIG